MREWRLYTGPLPTALPLSSLELHQLGDHAAQPAYYSESFLDTFLFLDKLRTCSRNEWYGL